MPIDIRATCTCSLGPLISASISDDYIQGNGLIKTRGSCEIKGLITPRANTVVTFSYTKDGVTRSVPRTLRVLSSFADPFRRTTKVELGCKLTYLTPLKEPAKFTAKDSAEYIQDYTEEDEEIIVVPIKAKDIAFKCLEQLGLQGGVGDLTNEFSIEKFDLSPGYVQVLGDLLVSENYCGYLNINEQLVIFPLNAGSGSGPVIDDSKIIDLGPIGVGEVPGESVTVSYSTLRLKKAKDNTDEEGDEVGAIDDLWEKSESSSTSYVGISYTDSDGQQAIKGYVNWVRVKEEVEYEKLQIPTPDPKTGQISIEEKIVPASRKTEEKQFNVALLGAMFSERLTNDISFDVGDAKKVITETFSYDGYGNETLRIEEQWATLAHAYGGAAVPWVFSKTDYFSFFNENYELPIGRTEVYTETIGNFQRIETRTFGLWSETIEGQQAIAVSGQTLTNSEEVENYLLDLYGKGLYLLNVSVVTQIRRNTQGVPSKADRIRAANAKEDGSQPENNYSTPSVAETVLAFGSESAKRRVDFAMPYAPDDVFTKVSGPPVKYRAKRSDAQSKAREYGLTQNKLLLGNRNGMNLQLPPENLPSVPFSPLVVKAAGVYAAYRVNANSWTMDSNGIIAGTDALLWGAIGGDSGAGSWVPVAPGVTSLPAAPVVSPSNEVTFTSVVPVWNETLPLNAQLRVGLSAISFAGAIGLINDQAPIGINTRVAVTKSRDVAVPAATVTVEAPVPAIGTSALVRPAAATITIEAPVPSVRFGRVVEVPAVGIVIAAPEIVNVGVPRTVVTVPSSAVALTAGVPVVRTGARVAVPAAALTVAAQVPTRVGPPADTNFSSVQLLLHLDGTNGSTTFTDSSNNALTVTPFGNAQISTAQSQFGGASALFDGSDDYLIVTEVAGLEPGSGDLTWEMWIRTTNSTQYATLMSRTPASFASGMWSLMMNHNSSAAGDLALYVANFSTGAPLLLTSGVNVRDGSWHHVAVVRNGSAWTLYVDGTSRATNTWGGTIADITGSIYIGRDQFYIRDYTGHIDELRITHGVARYTANFTPPTSAFPS